MRKAALAATLATALATALCAATGGSAASAATVALYEATDGWVVDLKGPIVKGDADRVKAALEAAATRPKRLVASLTSNGGDLVEATSMGVALRSANATTYVGDGVICTSACGIAWLGGVRRVVSASGHIGFHAAYDEESRQVTAAGRTWVSTYLAALGVEPAFVDYIYSKRLGQGLEWLTDEDARSYGLGMIVAPSNAPAGSGGSTTFVDALDEADQAYRTQGAAGMAAGLRQAYGRFSSSPSLRSAFVCFATELADDTVDERASAAEGRARHAGFGRDAWISRMTTILGRLGYDGKDSGDILNTWIGVSNRTLASQR